METSSHSSTENRASHRSIAVIAALVVLAFCGILLYGWTQHRGLDQAAQAEAQHTSAAEPNVTVVLTKRASPTIDLTLPGNIQAITETPILARAEGYVIKRYVDIGDRVKAGTLLAELDTPDLDQQVAQAQATLEQARAALAQARASVEQNKANAQLAEVTAKRNATLVSRGVLSQQEGDQSDAATLAQAASVRAAEANVAAAQQNVGASEANLHRLLELQAYKKVRAPFDGVITVRDIDTGALITTGSTQLFRMAQYGTLRIFANVPQSEYSAFHVGTPADIQVTELPGRKFMGRVARLSGALDTNTRTLLIEVQVENPAGILLPGMYAQVHFAVARLAAPMLVPGDTIVTRAGGTSVAVVDGSNQVHFRTIQLGRDFGAAVEVISGLEENEAVIVNPTDEVREGVLVHTMQYKEPVTPPNARPAKPAENGAPPH